MFEAIAFPGQVQRCKAQGIGADGQGLVEVEDNVASFVKLDQAGVIRL